MKIAFIGQKGIPAISGGIEKHVEEVAVRMAEKGHDVFVYARKHYTDKTIKKYRKVNIIHIPSIPTKHLDAISHTFFSTLHVLFSRYDIVHYQGIGPNLLNWIIGCVAGKSKSGRRSLGRGRPRWFPCAPQG